MAVDMIIKIEGIDGESQISGHEDEIDVLAFSWGATNSGSMHVGGGGGAGKVNVQDLSFTKYVDSASHALWKHVCDGTHIPTALLTCRKAGGEAVEYIKVELEEILVSSLSTGGSSGEDRQTENVTLNFAKFKFVYTPQDEAGAGGGEKEFAWDITANIAA